MTAEEKAKALYERDMGRLGTIYCSKFGLPMRWDNAPQAAKDGYFDAVANGDYEIEFER